jgi:hypothetical protein
MLTKRVVPVTIRFRNESIRTLEAIDKVCDEFGISRSATIKLICDRLIEVDKSVSNPLNSSPKILIH